MSHTSVSGLVGDSANSSRVFGLISALPLGHVGLRDEGGLDAELRELAAEQHDGRAEHAARADHVVARLQQAHAEQQDGAHAARGGDAGLGPSSAARRRSNIITVGLVKRE